MCVTCTNASGPWLDKAIKLAESLHLPFQENTACWQGQSLTFTENRLELRQGPDSGRELQGPLFVDFLSGRNSFRRLHNCTIKQPLARAVGIKGGFRPSVVDGTAGLGQDGFVLACLGCTVTMVERSPVLGALLNDGLQRALEDPTVGALLKKRIRLFCGDTRIILETLFDKPYTIYLDPMYPKRTASALNKKEMRIIRGLVGEDQDSASLLASALRWAGNRVVVKRPSKAPPLSELPPSHEIHMKNNRFDVYLTGLHGKEGHGDQQ
ncbi:MAG: class I SAM-dependent methyltransferase [Desulfocapsaceae bacterium]|nr:class I SAM-dependent methyltransferase [Desulfocapsaceae bacterium]